ncbi:hypothetical protein MMC27_004692 [Xylographa pallens]|nr:hypothetical protein [Xylographa pallens]
MDLKLVQSPHIYPEDVLEKYITVIRGIFEGDHQRERREYTDMYTEEQEDEVERQRQWKSDWVPEADLRKTAKDLDFPRPGLLKTYSYMEANLTQNAEDETTESTAADTEVSLALFA